jgi:hypothetical protein
MYLENYFLEKVSTKRKLELAKIHLDILIKTQPELFEGHCINGELNRIAQILKKEFIEILELARYEYKELLPESLGVELTKTPEVAIPDQQQRQNKEFIHKIQEKIPTKIKKYQKKLLTQMKSILKFSSLKTSRIHLLKMPLKS